MYFPFFILRDWGKRSAEARSSHFAVLPKLFSVVPLTTGRGVGKICLVWYTLGGCFPPRLLDIRREAGNAFWA